MSVSASVMKQLRQLLLALSVLFLLVPFHSATAAETVPEMGKSLDIPKQVKPVSMDFKPVEQASLSVVHIPNPCSGGCGYAPANCTYYVALWRQEMGLPVPDNLHDAKEWAVNAKAEGLEIMDKPVVGAVMVSTAGEYGHVALVLAVNADGSFLIREGNYDFAGSVRERVVHSPAGLSFIYF